VIRRKTVRANLDPAKRRVITVYETVGFEDWQSAERAVQEARVQDGKTACPVCKLRWTDGGEHKCVDNPGAMRMWGRK
jgi:hypothetical protein